MKNITKVNKIHFLIHPGFYLAMNINTYSSRGKAGGNQEKYKKLLLDYEAKAKTLGPDELMFIFLHTDFNGAKVDDRFLKPEYLMAVKKIKEILGKRAVVMTESFHVRNSEADVEKLTKIALARGYEFDKNVLSEAYGETLACCVKEGAENLNRKMDLKEVTEIDSKLTDVSCGGSEREVDIDRINGVFKAYHRPLRMK